MKLINVIDENEHVTRLEMDNDRAIHFAAMILYYPGIVGVTVQPIDDDNLPPTRGRLETKRAEWYLNAYTKMVDGDGI